MATKGSGAKKGAGVWGIEIGQTAIKAMHCRIDDGEIVADAFDFVEYPKVLSQPEAVAEDLIADALNQLIESNESIRDNVCLSVPGQSGLAKFFKPPPVEVKKIADIVRYEARQQIPFDLADVVWDYQMMPGSMVEEGYALESEVGLFAMKREQVYRQLAPLKQADIEVDQVQLAPMALYNMLAYDRMHERIDEGGFDVDNPPPSTVMLSIGTDSSDLIITNGFRIWQRSMPIGGNHFTRQLTKDLKMTFAKAEHLKRNAREAADPKLIFQTMRPVFNDLVTEVQRSIGFFRSIDKKAEINELLLTGNTVKMPGLAAYLSKNLGFEAVVVDRFNRLGGDDTLSIPTFRDNLPTFAVCYGLCLQGLGLSQVHASLVPREILTERLVRSKKPWTVAALSTLLLGMSAHYVMTQKSWATTTDDVWRGAKSAVDQTKNFSTEQITEDERLDKRLTYLNNVGVEVAGNDERRLIWMELIKTINDTVPRLDPPASEIESVKDFPFDQRKDIHVTQMETKKFEDLSEWYTADVARRYREEMRNWKRITGKDYPPEVAEQLGIVEGEDGPAAPKPKKSRRRRGAKKAVRVEGGPEGPGWVIQLDCYHYFNNPENIGLEGSNHVRKYLTTAFLENEVELPVGRDADGEAVYETFTMPEMGISFPLLLEDNEARLVTIPNPDYEGDGPSGPFAGMLGAGGRGGMMGPRGMSGRGSSGGTGDEDDEDDFESPTIDVRRLDFVFQIVWQEQILAERLEAKRLAREEAEKQKEEERRRNGDVAAN